MAEAQEYRAHQAVGTNLLGALVGLYWLALGAYYGRALWRERRRRALLRRRRRGGDDACERERREAGRRFAAAVPRLLLPRLAPAPPSGLWCGQRAWKRASGGWEKFEDAGALEFLGAALIHTNPDPRPSAHGPLRDSGSDGKVGYESSSDSRGSDGGASAKAKSLNFTASGKRRSTDRAAARGEGSKSGVAAFRRTNSVFGKSASKVVPSTDDLKRAADGDGDGDGDGAAAGQSTAEPTAEGGATRGGAAPGATAAATKKATFAEKARGQNSTAYMPTLHSAGKGAPRRPKASVMRSARDLSRRLKASVAANGRVPLLAYAPPEVLRVRRGASVCGGGLGFY